MSITRGALTQSPKLMIKCLTISQHRIGIWKCWILRREENRSTRTKTAQSKDENQQQTQPTYDAESGKRKRLEGIFTGRTLEKRP